MVALLMLAGLLVLAVMPVFAAELTASATLTGEAEVPGPGDPDGLGSAIIFLNRGPRTLCYEIEVSNIDTATAAHIHRGREGVAGPVVVNLNPPNAMGVSSGCVTNVSPALLRQIREMPRDFYVNVHNAAFPGGAVRGQLIKDTPKKGGGATATPTPLP